MADVNAMLFVAKGSERAANACPNSLPSVLICDENREICKTIARIINGLGYHAVAATDGNAALKLIGVQEPDLIILDENMPGLKAIDFLDAGLGHFLSRRTLLIAHRTAKRPRWLPTLCKPMEIGSFTRDISRLLCDTDIS